MSTAVAQIKDRLNIVDIISSYIKVEKAGINWKARCPFHNEKTPSFFISTERQSFYCFGCGEKGDVFSFVEKFEGLDFKETLKLLADRAGIKLETMASEKPKSDSGEPTTERLLETMEQATRFFSEKLAEHPEVAEYLKKRGLQESLIGKWRLGFVADEWRSLSEHLEKLGFSKNELLTAGLLKKSAEHDKYYDTFRDRIMFPISDAQGRVIAFSGRAWHEAEGMPKYLNSPDTPLFHKSQVLYGFHLAKQAIRKLDYVVLVEGQMDLLMSHQAGVTNAVASSGTALTLDHLRKLSRLSARLIIAYDADSAGREAAWRAGEMAIGLGLEVKIASLPEGEDPGSLAANDPAAWRETLREAVPYLNFVLEKTALENSSSKLTKAILQQVLPLADIIPSEIEKSQFVKKIAIKARVSEETVWQDLQKIRREKKLVSAPEPPANPSSQDEREILLFEAERYGFKIDQAEVTKEKEKRNLLKDLKEKLQMSASILDDTQASKVEKEEAEQKIKDIEKRIRDLH